MAKIRNYLIGRSEQADVVFSDGSVSRHHAELTLSADGRYYLSDRASTQGTFVMRGSNWGKIRQDFVAPHDLVRFGNHQTTAAQLLEMISSISDVSSGKGKKNLKDGKDLPSGPVRRNPETGELIPIDEETGDDS